MPLPKTAHTSRPWRIHEVARDFDVEDVWALPTPGGAGDFPRLVALFTAWDPMRSSSPVAGALAKVRSLLGGALGWDRPGAGLGGRVDSLRERLPADLRDGPPAPRTPDLPFRTLYLTDDEWALEIANQTVHAVLHLGWVEDGAGGHRGQMAILVKPNGRLGRAYMAAIAPFRYLIVYPAAMRDLARMWRERSPAPVAA